MMAVTEAGGRLVRKGVVVPDRDLNDPGLQRERGRVSDLLLGSTDLRFQIERGDDVWVEPHHERGVGRADVCHSLQRLAVEQTGDGRSRIALTAEAARSWPPMVAVVAAAWAR